MKNLWFALSIMACVLWACSDDDSSPGTKSYPRSYELSGYSLTDYAGWVMENQAPTPVNYQERRALVEAIGDTILNILHNESIVRINLLSQELVTFYFSEGQGQVSDTTLRYELINGRFEFDDEELNDEVLGLRYDDSADKFVTEAEVATALPGPLADPQQTNIYFQNYMTLRGTSSLSDLATKVSEQYDLIDQDTIVTGYLLFNYDRR